MTVFLTDISPWGSHNKLWRVKPEGLPATHTSMKIDRLKEHLRIKFPGCQIMVK